MIKKTFSVATGFDQSDAKEFWLRKSPLERLEAIELMRQMKNLPLVLVRR